MPGDYMVTQFAVHCMLYKIMVTHIDAGTRADDEGDRPFFLFFLLARWSDFGSKTPPPPPPPRTDVRRTRTFFL